MTTPRLRATVPLLFCAIACGGGTPGPRTQNDGREASADEAESEVGAEDEADDLDARVVAPAQRGGLLAEAARAVDTMTASTYSHKTHVEGTVYDVDCSGFLDYLLRIVDPEALHELVAATVKRPLAKHFVDFFSAPSPHTHWARVARVQDMQPGDVLAWRRPADVVSKNTGHVMLVTAAPSPRGADSWVVAIIDSTASPHGPRDPRRAEHHTGIGRGVVVLDTDAAGAPLRYHWTDVRTSPAHITDIAIGRLRN